MKRLLLIALTMGVLSLSSASCSPELPIDLPETERPVPPSNPDNQENNENNSMSNKLRITVGTTSFAATLYDNAAATDFKSMLPMTVKMSEMNGNEKLYYLPNRLSTSASAPGSIRTGDLMLWGSDCLVLFYKSFSSSYSYTRLGRIENAAGLETALGSGSITVAFEWQ